MAWHLPRRQAVGRPSPSPLIIFSPAMKSLFFVEVALCGPRRSRRVPCLRGAALPLAAACWPRVLQVRSLWFPKSLKSGRNFNSSQLRFLLFLLRISNLGPSPAPPGSRWRRGRRGPACAATPGVPIMGRGTATRRGPWTTLARQRCVDEVVIDKCGNHLLPGAE